MSELESCEEVSMDILQFRIINPKYNARIPSNDLPENFILSVDQNNEVLYFTVKNGVGSAPLKEVRRASGDIEYKMIFECEEPITFLYSLKGRLLLSTDDAFYVSGPQEEQKQKISIERSAVSGECLVGELYFCFINTDNNVCFIDIDSSDLSVEVVSKEEYSFISCSAGGDAALLVSLEDKCIKQLTFPDLTCTKKWDLPKEIKVDDVKGIHSIEENLVALHCGKNILVGKLNETVTKWINWADPFRVCSDNSKYFMQSISSWSEKLKNLLIVADSSSLDVVCGGITEGAESQFTGFYIDSDEFVPQMTFVDGEETFPLSLALDFTSSSSPVNTELPPQPLLWIYGSAGNLIPFYIIYLENEKAHSLMKYQTAIKEESPSSELDSPSSSTTAISQDSEWEEEQSSSERNISEQSDLKEINDISSIAPEVAPVTYPELKQLTEDHGLVANAVTTEIVKIYEGVREELRRLKSINDSVNHILSDHRPEFMKLDSSVKRMELLSLKMNEIIPIMTREVQKVNELKAKGSLIKFQLYTPNQKVSKSEAITRIKNLLQKADNIIENMSCQKLTVKEKRQQLKSEVNPLLIEALSLLLPPPKPTSTVRNMRDDPKWKILTDKLANRKIESINVNKAAIDLSKAQSQTNYNPIPIPKSLNLPPISITSPSLPTNPSIVSGMNFNLQNTTLDSSKSFGNRAKPAASSSSLFNPKVEQKPFTFAANTTPSEPKLQSVGSFGANKQNIATSPFSLSSSSPAPSTVSEISVISQVATSKSAIPLTESCKVEEIKKPIPFSFNINPSTVSQKEQSPNLPNVGTPSKLFEPKMDSEVESLASSPTPRPKQLDSNKETLSLTSLSMESEATKIEEKKTSSVSQTPFGFSSIPTQTAQSQPTASSGAPAQSNAFSFKPSVLESAAPTTTSQSIFTAPSNSFSFNSTGSLFASQPAFGTTSTVTATPTFGSSTSFGTPAFGQTSAFGFKAPSAALPPSAPPTQGGFAAYSSNAPANGSALFGAASNVNSQPSDKKQSQGNLPTTFTQFRD